MIDRPCWNAIRKNRWLTTAIQTRYDQLVPALIPLSQMVDSVVVRNEVREYQPHPSATTFLRDVYKVREGEKG